MSYMKYIARFSSGREGKEGRKEEMKKEKKEGRKDLFDITHYDLNKAVLSQSIIVQTNTDQL